MAVEIERKFLVDLEKIDLKNGKFYKQGYLNDDKERTVRVRLIGEKAFLTIKGVSQGIKRSEFEYEIPLKEGEYLLDNLCKKPLIEKYRHLEIVDGKTWEIDLFLGENEGLVVAEIELGSEEEKFTAPSWIKEEVSSDSRYFNSSLSQTPFKKWK